MHAGPLGGKNRVYILTVLRQAFNQVCTFFVHAVFCLLHTTSCTGHQGCGSGAKIVRACCCAWPMVYAVLHYTLCLLTANFMEHLLSADSTATPCYLLLSSLNPHWSNTSARLQRAVCGVFEFRSTSALCVPGSQKQQRVCTGLQTANESLTLWHAPHALGAADSRLCAKALWCTSCIWLWLGGIGKPCFWLAVMSDLL